MTLLVTEPGLKARRLGIDTYQEPVVYLRKDSPVCRSEGFEAQTRVLVTIGPKTITATLNVVTSELLHPGEIGLSEAAWQLLKTFADQPASITHAEPLESMSFVRAKVYGNRLQKPQFDAIIRDVMAGRYSEVHTACFVTASADDKLDAQEIVDLTRSMIDAGERIHWEQTPIMDKHCVGGLPGNRTTPLVVSIVAAFGLTIPKTSSRAITSPAGTADTMEVFAPVNLDTAAMKRVVEREGGCVVWGGSVRLSPADDLIIRVERALELDSTGQMVASILSKKAAAGATHVLIDIPIGPTAKIRTPQEADDLQHYLLHVGRAIGMNVDVVLTDGSQPVGRGVGPALEARDVIGVLRNDPAAPADLAERATLLAGRILELSGRVPLGLGRSKAAEILRTGAALRKFEAICDAQGGRRELVTATHTHSIDAPHTGVVTAIDNRRLAKIAKLAGAPQAKAAGVDLHCPVGSRVERGMPLFTVHAETPGEMQYALKYIAAQPLPFGLEKDE
jgi:thymidine phosphorylase